MALEKDPPVAAFTEDFSFAGARVRPSLNRVEKNGRTIQLEPKIMEVLTFLAERRGEVVSKEDLLRRVWKGTFVSDDVLSRAIAELRRVFGDDPATPRVIETIRKRGYRLLALPPGPDHAAGSTVDGSHSVPTLAIAAGVGVALLAAVLLIRATRPAGTPAPLRIVPVTTFLGNERHPALSPDGTRVAFAWERDGQRTSLFLKLLSAPTAIQLTTARGSDDEPAWSSDGQKIAFVRRTKDSCEIFSVPSIGGPAQRIADCGSPDAGKITWSPSGQEIALSGPAPGGARRIEILGTTTGARQALTRPPADVLGDEEPAFSPDGKTISFLRSVSDGVSDIYTIASAGGEPRRITFENRAITGADWSPDGKSLIFSSNRAGLFSLWKIGAGGGEPTLLAGGGSKMKHPSTARRVNAVAYENWHYEVSLWGVPTSVEGPDSRVTFASDEWEFDPEFSADGRRLAYVSTKSGADEIWTTSTDGGSPVQLTTFGGPRLGMPRWSPNGKMLVFSARPEGQADLYKIDASGGMPMRLTFTPGDEVAPSWSRDGTSIYFASRRTGTWEIWRMPATGGSAHRMTLHGGQAAYESADGKWLYFSRSDSPGIWRMPSEGGAETQTPASLAPNCWADWRVTGKGIYFKVEENHEASIVRFLPFDSAEAKPIARLGHQAWAGFTVSPDDSKIVYGRADRYECDIRMVENAF